MTVNHVFPKMLLALGLAFLFLVSMPSPGLSDTCQQIYERSFGPNSGWVAEVDPNTATGECTLTGTRVDFETGEITKIKYTYNDSTGWGSRDIETVMSGGSTHSKHTEGYVDEYPWSMTSQKWTDGNGWELTMRYDSKTGGLKSEEEKFANGSSITRIYDPASCHQVEDERGPEIVCNMISKTERYANDEGITSSTTIYDPASCPQAEYRLDIPDVDCRRISMTETDAGGSTTYTKYEDGKAIEKYRVDGKTGEKIEYNCHLKKVIGNEECLSREAEGLGQYGSNRDEPRQQSHERAGGGFESATNAPPILSGLTPAGDLTGARQKLKDEVLGQIEGKPRGDLLGAKQKTQTGGMERIKKKPGETTGSLDRQPLPPSGLSPLTDSIGVATSDGGLPSNRGKTRTGRLEQIKKKSGDSASLKSQPLPAGRSSDKSLQLKDTTKLEGTSVGHKEKLRIPRSQSVDQVLQSGAGKQKVQIQGVKPFEAKTKRWGTSAGSSGAYPRLR